MDLTKHAQKRKRRRGFSSLSVDIILKYGRTSKAVDGATMIHFDNNEYQKIVSEIKAFLRSMERAKGGKIITIGDYIITMYKDHYSHNN